MTNIIHHEEIIGAFALKLRQGKIISPEFKMVLTNPIQHDIQGCDYFNKTRKYKEKLKLFLENITIYVENCK